MAALTNKINPIISNRGKKKLHLYQEFIIQRTKDLQEKIEELEKFYKIAVGRELKMTELKKEIEQLKERLNKQSKIV